MEEPWGFTPNDQKFFEQLGVGTPGALPMPSFISPSEVRSQVRQMAPRIFQNWETLMKITERYEDVIRRRWSKKSKPKRRDLLLAAWPDMAKGHRPDLAVFKSRRPGQPHEKGSRRDAFMWPYINLEDLSQTEPLLLMINSRGRHPPDAFAHADGTYPTLGHVSRSIDMPPYLNEYTMAFNGRRTPSSYGQLYAWDGPEDGFELMVSRKHVLPGEGLCILEIQDRLYRFLVDVTKAILHDVPTDPKALTDPSTPIIPEPPSVSSKDNDTGITSLATTNMEVPYRLPANLDLSRLLSLVASELSEVEDHLWALREDPSYFSATLLDWKEHRQEMLLDTRGDRHPRLEPRRIGQFWEHVVGNALVSALAEIEVWTIIHEKMEHLAKLQRKYSHIKFEDDLPEDYAMAFYVLHDHLTQYVGGPIGNLELGVFAAPSLRPYFRRIPPPTPTTSMIEIIAVGDARPAGVADFEYMMQVLFDQTQREFAGLPTIIDELDRITKTDRSLISAWVARQISFLALMSECIRQIDLFQPWASTFESQMAEEATSAKLREESNRSGARVLALFQQKSPDQAVSLAIPSDGRFKYPVDKPRSKKNVDIMRSAEQALDSFWATYLKHLTDRKALTPAIKNVLLRRQPQRTLEWVEPTPKVRSNDPAPDLSTPFGGLGLADKQTGKTPGSTLASKKDKIKTRGEASATTEATETNGPAARDAVTKHNRTVFAVDKRALKVFGTLFFTPSASDQAPAGETAWIEFLHAMRSVGFLIEKLYGSVWQFQPTKVDVERGICFHEPHPGTKHPFTTMRRYGRRLTRAYGWEGDMFVAE
jgi:hypothetical protein